MLEHLQILLRNSVEATFIIPSFFFDEDICNPDGRFKELRDAYKFIREHDLLEVLEVPIHQGTDDEYLEITIKAKSRKR